MFRMLAFTIGIRCDMPSLLLVFLLDGLVEHCYLDSQLQQFTDGSLDAAYLYCFNRGFNWDCDGVVLELGLILSHPRFYFRRSHDIPQLHSCAVNK